MILALAKVEKNISIVVVNKEGELPRTFTVCGSSQNII